MLPFLKKRKEAGVISMIRSPKGLQTEAPEMDSSESSDASAIEACASDLIDAVHARDTAKAAEAIKAAFEILDASPHVEGPHTNEE